MGYNLDTGSHMKKEYMYIMGRVGQFSFLHVPDVRWPLTTFSKHKALYLYKIR